MCVYADGGGYDPTMPSPMGGGSESLDEADSLSPSIWCMVSCIIYALGISQHPESHTACWMQKMGDEGCGRPVAVDPNNRK